MRNNGEKLGEITDRLRFEACGVAVDQSNGDVYVGDYSSADCRPLQTDLGGGAGDERQLQPAETSIKRPG